ncbi:hypothetical protein [Marivirga lumbricoides]|uniref:hypothetical protein n=1 Tax=Marivirga lumbricoides TaxID=1046115 RepID=UPI00166A48F0
MREKLTIYYQNYSIWFHLIAFIVLFLSTYALRHYLFLDDNIVLQSSQKEIRTEEDLEKGYAGLHFIWSLFNLINLFKLTYSAFFIALFVSIFNKFKFKELFKLALFALLVFVLENIAYTIYYLVFPPEIIKDMNINVFSLQDLFYNEFLRFFFGQLSLFNILYLILFAELIRWFNEEKTKPEWIYLLVFAGFTIKILISYFIF